MDDVARPLARDDAPRVVRGETDRRHDLVRGRARVRVRLRVRVRVRVRVVRVRV